MNLLRALGDEAAAIFGDAAPALFSGIATPIRPQETERQRDQRWVEEQRAKNFCAALGPHYAHLRGCDAGHPIHALAEDAE